MTQHTFCSSCYRFCLLTKVVFDCVQVFFVNTQRKGMPPKATLTHHTQANTYDFSDSLFSSYESWALLPPYFLRIQGDTVWLIHLHNWILNELQRGKWWSPLRTWGRKLSSHPYVLSRFPRISRNTVSEKLVYTVTMRRVFDLFKQQVCYSDCTAALLSAPTYYITSTNSTLVYH